jgi:hypothetical protein
LNLQLIATDLVSPIGVVEAPDDSKRLFIIDQEGKIWIVKPDGTRSTTPFLDVKGKLVTLQTGYDERGLLGLAFHPEFKTNGKFYVFYNAAPRIAGWESVTRVSEFKVSANDANSADISSEKIILETDHPEMNHNGGTIAFGPDGYLYIAIGDGGNRNDTGPGHVDDWYKTNEGGNAQNIKANLMGKILRIDVNNGNPYAIPPDNPFAGTDAKPEIYAYGFRNPYRFSFDMGGTHQLYAGDVGQAMYEEVDIVTKGGNYGWNVREGMHCFNASDNLTLRSSCPLIDSENNQPLIDPILELPNAANPMGGIATAIIGGNVYRGKLIPWLTGKYVFGIFSQGGNSNAKLYYANQTSTYPWSFSEIKLKDYIPDLGQFIKGFGQDLSGEIYITTSTESGLQGTTGKVYKLVPVKN